MGLWGKWIEERGRYPPDRHLQSQCPSRRCAAGFVKGFNRNRVIGCGALVLQDEEIDKELIATVAKLMNRP
jgi:hypothetical protein